MELLVGHGSNEGMGSSAAGFLETSRLTDWTKYGLSTNEDGNWLPVDDCAFGGTMGLAASSMVLVFGIMCLGLTA